MDILITGRHIDITDETRRLIEKNVESALKPIPNVVRKVQVIISQENYLHNVDAVIDLTTHKTLTASSQGKDLRKAIHSLEHKLNKQMCKLKEKIENHRP